MAETVWMRAKGQLTLPVEIREAARIAEGDPLEVELTPDGILLRPQKVIDAAQAWFWHDAWQAGERDASAQIAAEETIPYGSAEEFLRALDRPARPMKQRARRRDADV